MADIMEHRLSIPIIDLGPTRTCSVKDTSKAAKELYEAFKNVGFAYVKNHDVPEEVLNEAFRWSHQFFNLPQSDKDKAPHPPEAWHHRGYSSIGREKLSQMVFDEATLAETRKVPDTKESFDMGRDDDGSMPNVWMPPDMLPGFKEFYMEFYEICYALQLELLRLVAVGMGLDKEYFVPLTNNGSII